LDALLSPLVRVLSFPAAVLSKVPALSPFIRAARTSVGQKLLMAITGLSLSGFLVAHLSGNLLLYAGQEQFNAYAEKLHSLGPLLTVAEIGLFVLFAAHLGLAISTAAMNASARRDSYATRETKPAGHILPGGASSWMMVTGILVAVFLVTHLIDLRLKLNPLVDYSGVYSEGGAVNEFLAVTRVLESPLSTVVYAVGLIALGIHLSHGFCSALTTLGIKHKRWDGLIKVVGLAFAWVIAAGFLSLLIWARARPAPEQGESETSAPTTTTAVEATREG
jgi:succinate dehydrogenase / fumarate reductase cytochrome b subunit